MGNSFESKSALLTKNWTQLNDSTYKNSITGELIDCHCLLANSEEELYFNNNLLMKRASLAHPNVLKLIYFCSAPQASTCGQAKYSSQMYLEHPQSTLTDVLGNSRRADTGEIECVCCQIVAASKYLSERYGYFGVDQKMIWLAGESALRGRHEKQLVKVWISGDLKCNYPSAILTEQQMCKQLIKLLKRLFQLGMCRKSMPLTLDYQFKIDGLVKQVYQYHNLSIPVLQTRKRVCSEYSSLNGNQVGSVIKTTSREHVNNPVQFFPDERARRKIEFEHDGKLSNLRKESNQEMKSNGQFRKVNFKYTDGLTTPKHNKSYQQIKEIKEAISSATPTEKQRESRTERAMQVNNRVPNKEVVRKQVGISTFNLPIRQTQNSELLIEEESSDFKLKQLLQTERNVSESLKLVLQPKKESEVKIEVPVLEDLALTTKSLEQSYPASKVLQKKAKELTLRVQKNMEISYENSSRISAQSLESQRLEKSRGFEIVNEYKIAVEPKPYFGEVQIEQSQEFHESEPPEIVMLKSTSTARARDLKDSQSRASGEEKKKFVPSFQGDRSSRHHKEISEEFQKEHNTYIKKLQEVALSESKLQTSNAPQSERRHNQLAIDNTSQVQVLSSSNHPRGVKHSKKRQQVSCKPCTEGKARAQSGRRLQEEINSMYSQSSHQQVKKAKIMQKINNTEQILRQNRKKLQRLQLQKDLEIEKGIIKRQMQSLLISNMMADESSRIKEKAKHKKATFAELKAEASKILEDLNF